MKTHTGLNRTLSISLSLSCHTLLSTAMFVLNSQCIHGANSPAPSGRQMFFWISGPRHPYVADTMAFWNKNELLGAPGRTSGSILTAIVTRSYSIHCTTHTSVSACFKMSAFRLKTRRKPSPPSVFTPRMTSIRWSPSWNRTPPPPYARLALPHHLLQRVTSLTGATYRRGTSPQ